MQNHFGLLDTDVMPIFMIIALDIGITLRFSINFSTVICSPTIAFSILREASSGTYGPRVYFPSYKFPINNISFRSINQKYLIYRLSISIRSHFCKWPWRDWQPLYRVGCKFLTVCASIRWLVRRLLLDWYLGSQNWGKYLCYFAASPFPLQGKNQRKLKK